MTPDAAERFALAALGWLAADPDEAGRFLGAAGAGVDDLRARAADPEFLGFVLDHLLAEDGRVIAFCQAAGEPPEAVRRARAALPGGDAPDWT